MTKLVFNNRTRNTGIELLEYFDARENLFGGLLSSRRTELYRLPSVKKRTSGKRNNAEQFVLYGICITGCSGF